MWIVYGIQFETVTVTNPTVKGKEYINVGIEVQGQFQELHHVHAFPQNRDAHKKLFETTSQSFKVLRLSKNFTVTLSIQDLVCDMGNISREGSLPGKRESLN